MEKKQIGGNLIFGGLPIFLLEFISTILSFISNHPPLGVACISIGGGMFLLTYDEWLLQRFFEINFLKEGNENEILFFFNLNFF